MTAKRKQLPSAAKQQPRQGESAQALITHEQWSGVLPPPAALEHFNQLIDNGAERIMAMSEREQAHRHEMEAKALAVEAASLKRAQTIEQQSRMAGGALLLVCVVGAVFLALQGQWVVALGLVGVPVTGAIGWLIRHQSHRKGEK